MQNRGAVFISTCGLGYGSPLNAAAKGNAAEGRGFRTVLLGVGSRAQRLSSDE